MLTYFRTEYGRYEGIEKEGSRKNEYFPYQLDADNILVTTRSRAWVILTPEEFQLLEEQRVYENPELYSLLEDLGIILTKRNLQDIAKLHTQRYSYMNVPPMHFVIVLTNRCNQRCIYCHPKSELSTEPREDMYEELARKAVDFFFSVPRFVPSLRMEFQGGETLLRYRLAQKVMDYALEKGREEAIEVHFAMVTNLTLMTDKIAQDIQQRGNIQLMTSLDGPAEVHDKQRYLASGKGTHEKVTYWINRLRDVYGIRVGAMPTLTTHNIGHEKELCDEYQQLGIDFIPVRYVNFIGPAERAWPIRLSPLEYFESWKTAFEAIMKQNREGAKGSEGHASTLLTNMLTISRSNMCLRRPCGAGVTQLTVNQHGDIYACDASRSLEQMKLGNVLTHTYDDIQMAEPALVIRSISSEQLPKCKSCAFNAYCGHCAVRRMRQHGSPLPEGPEDFECEIALKMFPYLFRKLLNPENAAILNRWVP